LTASFGGYKWHFKKRRMRDSIQGGGNSRTRSRGKDKTE